MMSKKAPLTVLMLIMISISLSGCADLYNILQEYVPTPTPSSTAPIKIGENVPQSRVRGVTIAGEGNTIRFTGMSPYNLKEPYEYVTLNAGNTKVDIRLEGQGFGCTIMLGYKNPLTGVFEYIVLYEFTTNRDYELSKQVSLPFTTQYCLVVYWGGNWEVRITQ